MNIDQEANNTMTAEQVETYLKAHPGFFLERQNLLTELFLPHESGEAISLVERQVSLLRERNIESRKKLNQFIIKAKDNDELFAKTQQIILHMLETHSLQSLLVGFTNNCKSAFGIEAVQCVLFKPELATTHEFPQQPLKQAMNKLTWLGSMNKTISGHFREEELTFIFQHKQRLHSALIAPLKLGNDLIGIVGFGSTDAQHFYAEMDTLFVDFIVSVLNKQILKLAK